MERSDNCRNTQTNKKRIVSKNLLCEQDQALTTAMKRIDSFNQVKVTQIQKMTIEPLKKRL